jgi:hypothetical protein
MMIDLKDREQTSVATTSALGGRRRVVTGSVPEPALVVDECRRALDEYGCFVVRGVVSPERLGELNATLSAEYERLLADGTLFAGGGRMSGHLNCFPGKASRFVYDDLVAAGVIDVIGELRPDLVRKVRATLNFNLPGSVAQHYHADAAFLKDFLICNIAVVDTDLINGAIDVLPGTNREFLPFWRYAVQRTYKSTTRIPMQRGDILVRSSNLWHRGMPNRSQDPRPMMAITFGEVPGESDPFEEHGGEPFFFPNWFSTSRVGRLRERTFVTAPVTYSAYRFVRSLYGNRGYASY